MTPLPQYFQIELDIQNFMLRLQQWKSLHAILFANQDDPGLQEQVQEAFEQMVNQGDAVMLTWQNNPPGEP